MQWFAASSGKHGRSLKFCNHRRGDRLRKGAGRLLLAEGASCECQLPGLLLVREFAAPKLSLTSGSTWPVESVMFSSSMAAMGTLQNLAKVGFTAGGILCLHFPAVGSQLDSLNQPRVHHGKLF
jgi:hypothetical protein